jgi:phenylalanyl-tRNA synthetase beta chain
MKYSYLWLKELSGTKKTPAQLAELLTMRAFEFEEMKTEGEETQMEFSILPNRGHDALSHIGMAREICAIEGRKLKNGSLASLLEAKLPSSRLKVEIKDKNLCKRYIGAVVENIEVGPSPKWMQKWLLASGVKPINNVVDITNYVLLELGQPLHAFDFEKIAFNGNLTSNWKLNFQIRKAKKGENIKLLDEKIYGLNENDLVIADREKPIALAGVMGGFDSSITDKTTSIILESANFDAVSIRKTRTRHNISTESSYRFEREIDPNLAGEGAARAIELLQKFGGKSVKIVAYSDIYPKKVNPWTVKLDVNYANSLLGEKIPAARMKKILENLGLKVRTWKLGFQVGVPTRRIDLKTPEDLIEEIGRIFGYENIKEQPLSADVKTPPQNAKRNFENKLRDALAGLGFSEVMNYSFYGAEDIAKCGLKTEGHIEIENPLSMDQQYLRRALIPNMLKNVGLNLKNFDDVKIFEVGKKFREKNGDMLEISLLNCMLANESKTPFFELKGALEALLSNLGVENVKFEAAEPECPVWNPARLAKIFSGNVKIGKIGEINPAILKKYGIKKRVAGFGLKIDDLLELTKKSAVFKPVSKFPVVERDLSMFINKLANYGEIETNIRKSGGKLVSSVELFDVFEKEGEKSLALRLKIGSREKTLTSAEIDGVMKQIIYRLEKDLKVKVRK